MNYKTMRRGRFSLLIRDVENNSLAIRRIMGQCVIVRAEMMFMNGSIEYDATSWRFREVEQGFVIPNYEWVWNDTDDELTVREVVHDYQRANPHSAGARAVALRRRGKRSRPGRGTDPRLAENTDRRRRRC